MFAKCVHVHEEKRRGTVAYPFLPLTYRLAGYHNTSGVGAIC